MEQEIDKKSKTTSSNGDDTESSSLQEPTMKSGKRKRRSSNSGDIDLSAKKFIADDDDGEYDEGFNLLDFSDEVLLEMFLNCNSLTLYALSKTCKRFLKLIEDRRLWRSFDFSLKRMTSKQIKKLLTTIQTVDIKEFKVRGLVSKYPLDKWKNNTLTVQLLRKLSNECQQLDAMELYDGYVNFQKVKISDFPPTLKRLIFNGCQIATPCSSRLFSKIDQHLGLLEELSLEKCQWFETHDLVAFSKLPHLKRLNLRGCNSLKGCVPYGSIATRIGFKALEYLDIRDTPVSDSDIQCFNITATLREILMDCPKLLFKEHTASKSKFFDASNSSDQTGPLESSDEDDISKKASNSFIENTSDNQNNQQDSKVLVIESESEFEDSESSDSDESNENDGADDKGCGSNDENGTQQLSQCIHVVLLNGRLINANTGRRTENELHMHEMLNVNAKATEPSGSNQEPIPQSSSSLSQQNSVQNNVAGANTNDANSTSTEKCDNNQPGPSSSKIGENNTNKSVNKATAGPSNSNSANNHNHRENENEQRLRISWEVPLLRHLSPRFSSTLQSNSYISDRGLCSFGIPRRIVQEDIVWIRAEVRPPDTLLERITVRNYRSVTDVTLRHLTFCAPNLQYLDVTGTSVTREGIDTFLASKPQCHVVSNLTN